MRDPWTEEEIEIVRLRYRELGTKQMARLLGRSRGNVHRMAKKLGVLRSRIVPPERIERAKEMRAAGLTWKAISKAIGVAPTSVGRTLALAAEPVPCLNPDCLGTKSPDRKRGLCPQCYRVPEIRERYPMLKRGRPPKPKVERMPKQSEAGFTRTVIEAARLYGWATAHFRPAMNRAGKWSTAVQGDGVGFPDLVLVKGRTMVVAELKVGGNKPTPEQEDWLRRFAEAGIAAYVWRPEAWADIERILRGDPV